MTGNSGMPISVAGYPFDRVEGLAIEGCDVQFERSAIGDMNTHVSRVHEPERSRRSDCCPI